MNSRLNCNVRTAGSAPCGCRAGRWAIGMLVLICISIRGPTALSADRGEALAGLTVAVSHVKSDAQLPADMEGPAANNTTDEPDAPSGSGEQGSSAAASSRPQAPLPPLARLEHRFKRRKNVSRAFNHIEEGSGTVVGSHTILTHGHYSALGDPGHLSETMILSIAENGCLIPYRVQVADIATSFADESTTLLVLPDRIHLPDAAALGDPEQLENGELVSVLYWDDDDHRFTTLETTIVRIEDGIATVEDPDRVIGPGDSGSPVYDAEGELVGNVWSIVLNGAGERLPRIVVGLLPAGIAQHVF